MPSPDSAKELFYDSIAAQWDALMDQHELQKRLRLIFGALLRPEDVRDKAVLDAGCGTGHFSRVLASWGARLVSLDIGERLLQETQKKAATKTVHASLLDIPFADGNFSLVLCTEAIEHTADPRRAVAELGRVTAPGGWLVITVPNRVWRPAILLATALHLRPYQGHEHWVGYRELSGWLQDSGFDIERQVGFNLLPHPFFCRRGFDILDRLVFLHPFMINIVVRAKKRNR
jgi:2-polyprenyl-3-methyl-5-hydroxy-6-metoxy-1,4-benzoquinol methylase